MLPYCPALLSIQCCWFYCLLCGKIYDDDDDDDDDFPHSSQDWSVGLQHYNRHYESWKIDMFDDRCLSFDFWACGENDRSFKRRLRYMDWLERYAIISECQLLLAEMRNDFAVSNNCWNYIRLTFVSLRSIGAYERSDVRCTDVIAYDVLFHFWLHQTFFTPKKMAGLLIVASIWENYVSLLSAFYYAAFFTRVVAYGLQLHVWGLSRGGSSTGPA